MSVGVQSSTDKILFNRTKMIGFESNLTVFVELVHTIERFDFRLKIN